MPPVARKPGPLTLNEAKSQLDYDPSTGILTWKVNKPRIRKGMRAGNVDIKGHRTITICGHCMPEHRLIWFMMTGEHLSSDLCIDHINRIKDDNRWCNLRAATHSENYINSEQFGELRGIRIRKMVKGVMYRVLLGFGGKKHTLGTVSSIEEAISLRQITEIHLYGEFACPRN